MNNENKLEQAKRKVDAMMGLPGVSLRRTVVRTGDPLSGFTDYNVKLLRDEDKRFIFYAEWVDPDGEGYRIVLPHGVVTAIIRLFSSLMLQARKEGAVKAAKTRKARTEVPRAFLESDEH